MEDFGSPGLVVESCVHRRRHVHSTPCGYRCGCRCEGCRGAYYAARMRARSRTVASDQARQVVQRLVAAGWSLRHIAELSQVSKSTLANLGRELKRDHSEENGEPSGQRVPPQSTVTVDVQDRLLAVWASRRTPVGVARRLQGLMSVGFSQTFLARRLGCSARLLRFALSGERHLSPDLCDRVVEMYDRLWDADPIAEGMSEHGAGLSQMYAAAHLFVSPMAWDDDVIDDPAAKPCEKFGADSPPMTREERREEAIMLQNEGVPIEVAAERLGCTPECLQKDFYRNDIPGPYKSWSRPKKKARAGARAAESDDWFG